MHSLVGNTCCERVPNNKQMIVVRSVDAGAMFQDYHQNETKAENVNYIYYLYIYMKKPGTHIDMWPANKTTNTQQNTKN